MYLHQNYFRPDQQYVLGNSNPFSYRNQETSSPSVTITRQCEIINQRSTNITKKELTGILDQLLQDIKNIRSKKTQTSKFQDIITVLIRLRRPVLASVVQHRFFTLLPTQFNEILRQWNDDFSSRDEQSQLFRNLVRLVNNLFSGITEIQQYPSWFLDYSLINSIALCLTNLSKSDEFFHENNTRMARSFVHLFAFYNHYQSILRNETNTDQDKLIGLIEPIVICLTSNMYLDSFNRLQQGGSSKSKKEKFLLIHCPTFLTNYTGSRLEQIMTSLLGQMLSQYTIILDRLRPPTMQWKRPVIRAMNHLLKIVNHGSLNPNVIAGHIPFIDHVLALIDTLTLYNQLRDTLSNPETHLIHTAVSLLANYINEPTVLAHIKQKNITSSFLRFASAKYEPLVDNVYTILAHTTSEDDIKSMQNPGVLLSTTVNRLKVEMEKPSGNQHQVVQLLEVLKGLAQHDQLKEEIFKQSIHSFLLQCTNQLPQEALTPLFETFWSLSFNSDLATLLRGNTQFIDKLQTISKDTKNEALKKAADGLIWKLIREPEFLNKMAKQADEDSENETQVIIGADGKEQVVKTSKRGAAAQVVKVFEYDIMISYCHADKDLVKKIHKFLLEEGFKIWIDLENMFGPAMNAMAEAVENSEFVLLCMSDSYKQSTYCQAEAEYAFGCKRRLVPLIVRQGYRADGWLGFLIGARIYVNFGSFDFDTACEKLMVEIARQRQQPLPSKEKRAKESSKEATEETKEKKEEEDADIPLFSQKLPSRYKKREAALNFDLQYIDRWSESDVQDFLYTHQQNELMPLCENMNGQALVQLYNICLSQYHQTYNILNEQLKTSYKIILTIATYTKFLSVMKKVITPPRRLIAPVLSSPPMLPPVPERPMLLPPQSNSSNSDSKYDLIITSDAPALQMLQAVKRRGSRWLVNAPTWR